MRSIFTVLALLLASVFTYVVPEVQANITIPSPRPANLTWNDNSDNEDGFVLERNLNGGAFTVLAASLGANIVSYTDGTLQQSTTNDNVYCYRVRAFNVVGSSAYSNQDCATVTRLPTAPNAPSNLQTSSLSSTEIRITWQDNSDDEAGFRITHVAQQGPDNGVPALFVAAANVTNYLDAGLRRNTTYCYQVEAFNGLGRADSGESSCARTLNK